MPKNIKILLCLSLVINVLFIGIFLGGYMKNHHDRGNRNRSLNESLSMIIQTLPSDQRSVFQSRLASLRGQQAFDRGEMRNLRREIINILRQKDFDAALFQEKITVMNNLRQTHLLTRADLIKDIAQYLSVKERIQLTKLLIKPNSRRY